MSTYTTTSTTTFTVTHAAYLASKIATDLRLCSNYYSKPYNSEIDDYVAEITAYLRAGYLKEYEFGFKKDDKRIVCWRYTVQADGTITADDKAGKVTSVADIAGANYYNFLSKNDAWWALSNVERDAFMAKLTIKRTAGSLPQDGNGYWESDKNYSSGGVGVGRKTFRSL